MNHLETFSTSFRALKANKVRTLLTMLGIIIGVFSVILLVSLVKGVQNYITDQFNSLGSNLVYITPGRGGVNQDPAVSFTDNKLDDKHVKILKAALSDSIFAITPASTSSKTASFKGKKYFATVYSDYADYTKVFNLEIEKGRNYTDAESESLKRLAVLGPSVAKELFGTIDPIGQNIKLDDKTFTVVGLAKPKNRDFDVVIYVPFYTAINALDMENISYITIKLQPSEDVNLAMKKIESVLKSELKQDDFTVMNQADILDSITSILHIISIGLGAVAAISLLVGGIGIMNIMLVAVTERTREIGLRKALGATRMDISLQFIIEAVTLSLTGGIIGLLLGVGGSLIARQFIRTEVPLWAVLLSVGFSLAVGVIFGTYPAVKASKKDPIEALRYE